MKKWKFVFWLFTFIFITDLIGVPFRSEHDLFDPLFLVFGALSLIPFYGFSYQKGVGSKMIATVIFSINLIFVITSGVVIFLSVPLFVEPVTLLTILAISITSLFLFIYIYPQYMYAFKSEHIWMSNA